MVFPIPAGSSRCFDSTIWSDFRRFKPWVRVRLPLGCTQVCRGAYAGSSKLRNIN